MNNPLQDNVVIAGEGSKIDQQHRHRRQNITPPKLQEKQKSDLCACEPRLQRTRSISPRLEHRVGLYYAFFKCCTPLSRHKYMKTRMLKISLFGRGVSFSTRTTTTRPGRRGRLSSRTTRSRSQAGGKAAAAMEKPHQKKLPRRQRRSRIELTFLLDLVYVHCFRIRINQDIPFCFH